MKFLSKNALISASLFLTFIAYWMETIIYLSPNNPIKIQSYDVVSFVGHLNGQAWGFFAPPPTYDEWLYYTFVSKSNGSSVTFEVVGPVLSEKRREAPFNTGPRDVDYILYSSISRLQRMVIERKANAKLGEVNRKLVLTDQEMRSGYARCLINYALIVAKRQHIDPDDTEARFTVTMAALPPFSQRDKILEGFKEPERELFKSYLFDLSSVGKPLM